MSEFRIIFIYWLCCQYTTCYASVAYTWVSKTTTGEPCLNTCKNNECAVDYYLNVKPCVVSRLAGVPIYHTSLYKGARDVCLSNCGKFDSRFDYEWCFTTEEYHWDYCSSKLKSPDNVFGCDIYGKKCIDNCIRSDEYSPRNCHIESQAFQTCAIPADVPVKSCLNLFAYGGRTIRSPLDRLFSQTSCTNACRARARNGRDGETQERIDSIYAPSSGMTVENVTSFQPNSPYTFVATTNATNPNGNEVYLPLIVQATLRQIATPVPRQSSDITSEARSNVANMYNGFNQGIDVGHIVAFQNGGTRDLFNYVGQTAALNRGPYKMIENHINNWINFGGTVQLTVVVTYTSTTPEEFAVKLKFFNDDGSLHSDCLDVIIKNI